MNGGMLGNLHIFLRCRIWYICSFLWLGGSSWTFPCTVHFQLF